jgi:hypothetical protein
MDSRQDEQEASQRKQQQRPCDEEAQPHASRPGALDQQASATHCRTPCCPHEEGCDTKTRFL